MQLNSIILFITSALIFFVIKKVWYQFKNNKKNVPQNRSQDYHKFIKDTCFVKTTFDPAQIIFEMMREELYPEVQTFNILVEISLNHQNSHKALEIVESMDKKYKILPDISTYQILLKGVLHLF